MLHQKESNFPALSVIYTAGGEASTASSREAIPNHIYCVIKGRNDPESGQRNRQGQNIPFLRIFGEKQEQKKPPKI